MTPIARRLTVLLLLSLSSIALAAFAAGCAVDATGIAGSGPSGSLGSECSCSNGQADCDGSQGQCQQGLSCVKADQGGQVCTRSCPCPLSYVCKAAGVPGARLACFKQP